MAHKWQIILLSTAIIGGSQLNAMDTKNQTNDRKELKNSGGSDAKNRRNSQSTSTPRMYFPYPGGKPEPEETSSGSTFSRTDLLPLFWHH